MDIINTSDLASYVRESNPDEVALGLLVELANGIVTEVIGTLDPVPTRVRAVTLEVAARAYRNPQGASSETIDDYTYRRDGDTTAAGVYLTRAELATLRGLAGAVSSRAYTIGVVSPLDVP